MFFKLILRLQVHQVRYGTEQLLSSTGRALMAIFVSNKELEMRLDGDSSALILIKFQEHLIGYNQLFGEESEKF